MTNVLRFATRQRGEIYVLPRAPGDWAVDHMSEDRGSAGILASGFASYEDAYAAAREFARRLNARLFPPEGGAA